MTRNLTKSFVALAGAALALAACTSGGEKAASNTNVEVERTGGKKSVSITLIAKSNDNPVFQSARLGAEAAAKEISAKEGIDVKVDWRTPDKEDGTVQAQRIADAANQGADAILLSASDAAKVQNAVDEAVNKGVAVMTFDSDVPNSKRFAFYGADDMETGGMVMDELAKQIGEKGNVAILAGNQNAPNLQTRVKGVEEAAKKYPNIKLIGAFYHNEAPQDAAQKVLEVMQAHPEINGWAMVGGWPLFTQSLLDLDPNKVKIVAVDALPLQLPYVEKGIAPVLLAQPTYNWGYVSVKTIVDKLVNNKEVEPIQKMELVKVTKDNLKEWAQQLKDWGFSDVDPKYLQ